MNINSLFESKTFKWLLVGLAALVVLLLVFKLGEFVGMRKANFSYRWSENYHRMFGGPSGGFLQDFGGRDFIPGNGAVGTVMKIDGNSIIVKSPDGVEKTVAITSQTTIRRGSEVIKISEIAINNQIVVIGSPQNNGTVEAKFIRVIDPSAQPLPPPPFFRNFPKF
jgi:hypothetical protein